jgi:hypothetical protein
MCQPLVDLAVFGQSRAAITLRAADYIIIFVYSPETKI